MMIKFLTVEHREHLTQKSFGAAFKTATGSVEEGFGQVTDKRLTHSNSAGSLEVPYSVLDEKRKQQLSHMSVHCASNQIDLRPIGRRI